MKNVIEPFVNLGKLLGQFLVVNDHRPEIPAFTNGQEQKLSEAFVHARINNGWFTAQNIYNSLMAIVDMLKEEHLRKWLGEDFKQVSTPKRIGVVMAGNIPAVGFHDFLSVLVSGHKFIGKPSAADRFLPKAIAEILISIEPSYGEKIVFTDRLENIDAVIATGSNNTARYFEYYFGKYPNIIRKNRNSVAVLRGDETEEELEQLGKDIFYYFGLGCRNVSKLFVKEGVDLDRFFKAIFPYKDLVNHQKYGNNYDYNKTVYLMGDVQLIENGFLLLKEDIGLASPVAVVFYEYFKDEDSLQERLRMDHANIQCVVGNHPGEVPFGKAQEPALWDYADNINTLQFLKKI
jgi:hypothetical protein